jgi:hypothetical protein
MPKKVFIVPEITSKEVSALTIKMYKSRLNKLVPHGFSTVDELVTHPQRVVEVIDTLFPGNDPSPEHKRLSTCICEQCKLRETKRHYYNAIFYALADTEFIKTPNPLYYAFRKNLQNYNSH